MEHDNFYLLLELDFDKPETDSGVINAAIEKKRNDWSKLTNHPRKGIRANQCIAMIPELKKHLSNSEFLRSEATEAQKITYEPLDRKIGVAAAKGYMEVSEIEFLAKKFKLSQEKILKRIPKIEIRHTTEIIRETLEPSTIKKIEDNLKILKCENLYSFLQQEKKDESWQNKSCQEIIVKAKELASYFRNKGTTAENTSAGELSGLCITIIGNNQKRELYDDYLKMRSLKDVDEDIDFAANDNLISIEESENLVRRIMEKGLSEEDAEGYLKSYCLKKKYNIEVKARGPRANIKNCRACGLNVNLSIDPKKCPNCGMPHEVECPACKTINDSGNNICTKCDFQIGKMYLVKKACESAKLRIEQSEFERAEKALKEAETYWPGYKEILPLKEELGRKRGIIENHIKEIQTYVNNNELFAANNSLSKLKEIMPSYEDAEIRIKIDHGIELANNWLKKAKVTDSEKEIIEYCTKALRVCIDSSEAKKELMKYPPHPPLNLSVSQNKKSNIIKWIASKSENSTYIVLRKENTAPKNEKDGILIIETDEKFCEDKNLSAGIPYYYGVFAMRGGIYSSGAVLSKPVYTYLDVSDIAICAGNNSVNITWKVPQGIDCIEVWRKENSYPLKVGDGTKVEAANNEGLSDLNLKNDTTYYYTIFGVYQSANGIIMTNGVQCKCMPTAPPEQVKDLKLITNDDGSYRLTWSKTNKGCVNVYYSSIQYNDTVNDLKQLSSIEKQMKLLPVTEKTDTSVNFKISSEGVFYVYPIVVVNEMCLIGDKVRVASLRDFTDIKPPKFNGNKLYLEFTWPEKASKALIVYKFDSYANDPEDPKASKDLCTKIKYSSQASAILNNIERRNYFITIFAVYGESKNPVYSSGVKVFVKNEPIREIRYSIKPKKSLFGKSNGISFTLTGTSNEAFPPIQVVKKPNALPLNKNDGTVVCILENTGNGKNYTTTIEDSNNAKRVYYKLFLKNDSDYDSYKLVAPNANDLIVNSR